MIILHRDWFEDQEGEDYIPYRCGYYDDVTKSPGQLHNLKLDVFEGTATSQHTPETRRTRQGILKCFKKTAVYAMAGPGDTRPKPRETSAMDWSRKFKDSVVDFVTRTISKEEISR